jgi:hypothetical protein
MTVYVESNFLLELSLQQEESESCAGIVDLATTGRILLVVPAFSFAEPHIALSAKEKARLRLSNELQAHLGELARSKPHRQVAEIFGGLVSILTARAGFEGDGLRDTVSKLLQIAHTIPLDAAILRAAADVQIAFDMSGQDAIVLASVLAHLDLYRPAESCFLNRNSKDFDDHAILETLASRQCRLFSKFADGQQYILARIRPG